MAGQMVPEYTILGSFGELYDTDNNFQSHIQEVSANIQVDRQDIMMSGSRRVGYKYTSVHGEGTMRGFRVTSLMARRIANTMVDDRAPQWVGDIIVVLNDPEIMSDPANAGGPNASKPQVERLQLIRCKWRGVNLGWAVNQIIEEDTPFTFQNIKWIEEIRGDQSVTGGSTVIPPLYKPPDLPVIVSP